MKSELATVHRMLFITTGGTVGGQVAADEPWLKLGASADDLYKMLGPTVGYLNAAHDIEIDVTVNDFADLDSSNIGPAHWTGLAETIRDAYNDFDSVLITHGTNTLAYTAAALSFSLANPAKPIVLTGSQVPAQLAGSDALINLENAARLASWRRETTPVKGVIVVFGSRIIAGTRVKKSTEFDYDALVSFGTEDLGRVGRIISMNEPAFAKHVSYLRTAVYPEARYAGDLRVDADFDMRIVSLTEYPGMSPDIFQRIVDSTDVKGFVLRSFGAGDPSGSLRPAFEFLRSSEIPIVVTTQAPRGVSNFQVNESGRVLRNENLAIPAHDMSIEALTTKLGWLLARRARGELSYSQLCQEMVRDLRGEINVVWELGV